MKDLPLFLYPNEEEIMRMFAGQSFAGLDKTNNIS